MNSPHNDEIENRDLPTPPADAVNGDSAVPAELRAAPQWGVWRAEDGTKVPYQSNGRRKAASTRLDEWGSYEQALAAVGTGKFAGPAFVFTPEDPFFGIDLDDCRDPVTGAVAAWAQEIVDDVDSYTEISPSKTGLKIFGKGKLDFGGRKLKRPGGGAIEVYDQARFFTVTREPYANPGKLAEYDVAAFVERHWGAGGRKQTRRYEDVKPLSGRGVTPEDYRTLERQVAALKPAISGDFGGDTTFYAGLTLREAAFMAGCTDEQGFALFCLYNDTKCFDKQGRPCPWDANSRDLSDTNSLYRMWHRAGAFMRADAFDDVPESTTAPEAVEDEDAAYAAALEIFPLYDFYQLRAMDLRVECLIENLIAKWQPFITSAPMKSFKSTLTIEMLMCLAAGVPWGPFDIIRPRRVLYLVGEGGLIFVRQRHDMLFHNFAPEHREALRNMVVSDKIPRFKRPAHLKALGHILRKDPFDLVAVDPSYLAADGNDANNVALMGTQISNFNEVCFEHGATPLYIHHKKKGNAEDKSSKLEDMAGAGWGEIAGGWLCISKQSEFKHGKITLRAESGGRLILPSDHFIKIEHGDLFGEPTWRADWVSADDSGAAVTGEAYQKMLAHLAGETKAVSKSSVKSACGISGGYVGTLLRTAVARNDVVEVVVGRDKHGNPIARYEASEATRQRYKQGPL